MVHIETSDRNNTETNVHTIRSTQAAPKRKKLNHYVAFKKETRDIKIKKTINTVIREYMDPVLWTDGGLVCSAEGRICSNMLQMRSVHLTKGQAYSKETNPSSRHRGCYIRTITARA
jgi:hypothetical protein